MPKQGKAGASQGLPLQKLLFVLQFFKPLRLYAHIIKHPHPRKLSLHGFCQRQQAVFSVRRFSSANTRTRGRGFEGSHALILKLPEIPVKIPLENSL